MSKTATNPNAQSIAQTINSQISIGTKMFLGARDFAFGTTKDGMAYLRFKFGRGNRQALSVIYNEGIDLYSIELCRAKGRGLTLSFETETVSEGVYHDMLNRSLIEAAKKVSH